MQDRPTALELLEAVQRFLEEEIVPNTEGRRAFLARVAASAVRIVEREIRMEEEQALREWDGLDALLGPETPPSAREEWKSAIRARTAALCERIREGAADEGDWRRKVLAHTRRTVRDKIAVSDPGLLERSETKSSQKD
jgi:hypothetical protein